MIPPGCTKAVSALAAPCLGAARLFLFSYRIRGACRSAFHAFFSFPVERASCFPGAQPAWYLPLQLNPHVRSIRRFCLEQRQIP